MGIKACSGQDPIDAVNHTSHVHPGACSPLDWNSWDRPRRGSVQTRFRESEPLAGSRAFEALAQTFRFPSAQPSFSRHATRPSEASGSVTLEGDEDLEDSDGWWWSWLLAVTLPAACWLLADWSVWLPPLLVAVVATIVWTTDFNSVLEEEDGLKDQAVPPLRNAADGEEKDSSQLRATRWETNVAEGSEPDASDWKRRTNDCSSTTINALGQFPNQEGATVESGPGVTTRREEDAKSHADSTASTKPKRARRGRPRVTRTGPTGSTRGRRGPHLNGPAPDTTGEGEDSSLNVGSGAAGSQWIRVSSGKYVRAEAAVEFDSEVEPASVAVAKPSALVQPDSELQSEPSASLIGAEEAAPTTLLRLTASSTTDVANSARQGHTADSSNAVVDPSVVVTVQEIARAPLAPLLAASPIVLVSPTDSHLADAIETTADTTPPTRSLLVGPDDTQSSWTSVVNHPAPLVLVEPVSTAFSPTSFPIRSPDTPGGEAFRPTPLSLTTEDDPSPRQTLGDDELSAWLQVNSRPLEPQAGSGIDVGWSCERVNDSSDEGDSAAPIARGEVGVSSPDRLEASSELPSVAADTMSVFATFEPEAAATIPSDAGVALQHARVGPSVAPQRWEADQAADLSPAGKTILKVSDVETTLPEEFAFREFVGLVTAVDEPLPSRLETEMVAGPDAIPAAARGDHPNRSLPVRETLADSRTAGADPNPEPPPGQGDSRSPTWFAVPIVAESAKLRMDSAAPEASLEPCEPSETPTCSAAEALIEEGIEFHPPIGSLNDRPDDKAAVPLLRQVGPHQEDEIRWAVHAQPVLPDGWLGLLSTRPFAERPNRCVPPTDWLGRLMNETVPVNIVAVVEPRDAMFDPSRATTAGEVGLIADQPDASPEADSPKSESAPSTIATFAERPVVVHREPILPRIMPDAGPFASGWSLDDWMESLGERRPGRSADRPNGWRIAPERMVIHRRWEPISGETKTVLEPRGASIDEEWCEGETIPPDPPTSSNHPIDARKLLPALDETALALARDRSRWSAARDPSFLGRRLTETWSPANSVGLVVGNGGRDHRRRGDLFQDPLRRAGSTIPRRGAWSLRRALPRLPRAPPNPTQSHESDTHTPRRVVFEPYRTCPIDAADIRDISSRMSAVGVHSWKSPRSLTGDRPSSQKMGGLGSSQSTSSFLTTSAKTSLPTGVSGPMSE